MTEAEIFTEISEIIREVLDQPNLAITGATTADGVEGWDSFNHINIVVAIEEKFGIKIRTAEVEEVKNVGELTELVEKKLGKN
jgi:acyl carrier protein